MHSLGIGIMDIFVLISLQQQETAIAVLFSYD